MKHWILSIFRINNKLEAKVKRQERYIEQYSQSTFAATIAAYDEILYHIDKKIRYINLRVMYNEFEKTMTPVEFSTLKAYAKGESATYLAQKQFMSRAAMFRSLDHLIKKCRQCLEQLGFTQDRLQSEYSDIVSTRN